jgi:hypothetical protein
MAVAKAKAPTAAAKPTPQAMAVAKAKAPTAAAKPTPQAMAVAKAPPAAKPASERGPNGATQASTGASLAAPASAT